VTAEARLLDPAPVVLDDVPLAIDPAEVRAFQGYKPIPLRPAAEWTARLDAARAAVARVMRPRLAYRTTAVARVEPHRLALAGGVTLCIPWIGEHWGAVEAVAAAVATLGPEAEELVRAGHEARDALEASVLDGAASAAVECLAEWGNDHLCRLGVAEGRRVTNRVSPGLAGWDLTEQALVLGLCPAAAIGVRLDATGLLRPAKSISFLAGIGRGARVDHYFVQCRRCWVPDCPWRRAPAGPTVQREETPGPID